MILISSYIADLMLDSFIQRYFVEVYFFSHTYNGWKLTYSLYGCVQIRNNFSTFVHVCRGSLSAFWHVIALHQSHTGIRKFVKSKYSSIPAILGLIPAERRTRNTGTLKFLICWKIELNSSLSIEIEHRKVGNLPVKLSPSN